MIIYVSRQMVQAEYNFLKIEHEDLIKIFILKNFKHYLLGGRFLIMTDHKTLNYIFNNPNAKGKIA